MLAQHGACVHPSLRVAGLGEGAVLSGPGQPPAAEEQGPCLTLPLCGPWEGAKPRGRTEFTACPWDLPVSNWHEVTVPKPPCWEHASRSLASALGFSTWTLSLSPGGLGASTPAYEGSGPPPTRCHLHLPATSGGARPPPEAQGGANPTKSREAQGKGPTHHLATHLSPSKE